MHIQYTYPFRMLVSACFAMFLHVCFCMESFSTIVLPHCFPWLLLFCLRAHSVRTNELLCQCGLPARYLRPSPCLP